MLDFEGSFCRILMGMLNLTSLRMLWRCCQGQAHYWSRRPRASKEDAWLTPTLVKNVKQKLMCLVNSLRIRANLVSESNLSSSILYWNQNKIITHLAVQTYVWHGCKWNFAGPQIYLQPAKIKSQHFGVSLKFLVCNWKYCIWRLTVVKIFHFKCVFIGQPVSEISKFLTAYIQLKP